MKLAIAFTVACFYLSCPAIAGELKVQRVFVQLIDQVELSASAQGILMDVSVQPGDLVKKGQAIAKLDDREAAIALKRAEVDHEIAKRKADDKGEVRLAQKLCQQATQNVKHAKIENQAAHLQSDNQLAIKAAVKSTELAKNQLQRASAARSQFSGSVSQSEIDELTLALEHAELETQQAQFQQRQDALAASASDEAIAALELTVEQHEVRIEQAKSSDAIATLDAQLAGAMRDAAELNLEKHQVKSSLDGVVEQVHQRAGQWVRPGDAIVRVLRLDRLQVEGYLPIESLANEVVGCTARLTIIGFAGATHEFDGVITFMSSEVDAVNKEVAVRAEFDNVGFKVRPGMQGSMSIMITADDAKPAKPGAEAGIIHVEADAP